MPRLSPMRWLALAGGALLIAGCGDAVTRPVVRDLAHPPSFSFTGSTSQELLVYIASTTTDEDGGPTFTLDLPATVVAGDAIDRTIGVDPGLGSFAAVDWGDGTAGDTPAIQTQSACSPTLGCSTDYYMTLHHVYASAGDFTVIVGVYNTDMDGTTVRRQSVTVTPAPDVTPPVLTLPSDTTVDATGPDGATVTWTASATDAVDGTVDVTCDPASGSTFPMDTTTVTCTASDAAGNEATGTFMVTVVDATTPVLTLPSDTTVDATGAGTIVSWTATATDDVDGAVDVTCKPVSGSVFSVGTTTVDCSASDAAGNEATGSFTVTVLDVTPPVLTLPADMTVDATGPGTPVSWTATATDDVDGSVDVTCAPASGSTFSIGTTTVNCSATDAAGNEATGSFTVTVADVTPPVLALPSDITVDATGPDGAIVSFTATATDNVDGSVAVTCAPASGSTFSIGTTTVSCSANDAAGNEATSSFAVTVLGAAGQLSELEATIGGLSLDNQTENSLLTKVRSAEKSLDKGNVPATCSQLSDLLVQIADFQSAGKLTAEEVAELTGDITRIQALLGC